MDTSAANKKLTPEKYNVCFRKGTEPPGSEKRLHTKAEGIYVCVSCGQALFKSDAKFDSGTGWPSFWDAADKSNIKTIEDSSPGIKRTEVLCAACGAHLGHVFNDGSQPTGLRYCINSLSLNFQHYGKKEKL